MLELIEILLQEREDGIRRKDRLCKIKLARERKQTGKLYQESWQGFYPTIGKYIEILT